MYYIAQKYWATTLKLWIQVFWVSLKQVYEIKHLATQSAFTNTRERLVIVYRANISYLPIYQYQHL